MKRTLTILLSSLLVVVVANAANLRAQEDLAAPPAQSDKKPQTVRDQASYGIGRTIGRNLRSQGLEVDPAMLARGIADYFAGAKSPLTEAEIRSAINQFEQEMQARSADRKKQLAAKNQREGGAFLAANKKQPGVQTLPSGLQYKVIKQGNGATPKATDQVKTHYHGTLIDGTVFDSSVQRGEPISFPVNGVIRGWTEALQLMKVGDKWQLVVPADLAYGERGTGSDIGPHAVLIFEVELLGIE